MQHRWFQLFSWLTVVTLIVAACGGGAAPAAEAPAAEAPAAEAPAAEAAATETPVPEEAADTTKATEGESTTAEAAKTVGQFAEAPMLAEMVTAGSLPPVDERLPKDYMVVEPYKSIGQYGGTLRTVTGCDTMCSIKMWLYDPPIRWKADYSGYEPGLAKAFEWSEDGTQVTLHFREGVKWSDGEPFTMADMKFWWEDIALNPDYKLVEPPWWGYKSDKTPMDVEFPDDFTMVMRWDKPQWVTPYIIAQGFWEWEPLMKPAHYLKQFHPTYTPSATYEDLEAKDRWWENPDYPVLFAWKLETYTPGERWMLVRNPFYWKVDPEGNQLPYIDRLDVELVLDEETRVLQLAQGKYDLSFREARDVDTPFLSEQAAAGEYDVNLGWMTAAGANPGWLINQDYIGPGDDPDLDKEIRELLRDKRFRQALSYGVNRQRILDVGFDGIGEIKSFTISRQSWHFQSDEGKEVFKRWEEAYADYDVDKANALLDEVGLKDTDGDGMRELASGKPLEIIIDYGTWGAGEDINLQANEILKENLEAMGIKSLINNLVNQPDWDLRQTEAKYMLRNAGTSELDIWTYPDWVFPVRDNRAWPLQGKWRQTGGQEGEEPLPDSPAAKLQALYDKGLAEKDPQKRHEIVWEAVQIHIDEGPFMLGVAGDNPVPVIIKKNVRNIPDTGILGPWAPGSPGNKNPEQFYLEQ